jgi:hypothetical protein
MMAGGYPALGCIWIVLLQFPSRTLRTSAIPPIPAHIFNWCGDYLQSHVVPHPRFPAKATAVPGRVMAAK